MNESLSSSYHSYRPNHYRTSFATYEKPGKEPPIVNITESNNVARVDLSGVLDRDNAAPIKEKILKKIHRGIKTVEFHLEKAKISDAPAMALLVIVVKKLQDRKINSSINGLKKDYLNLANMLGLHLVSKIKSFKEKEV